MKAVAAKGCRGIGLYAAAVFLLAASMPQWALATGPLLKEAAPFTLSQPDGGTVSSADIAGKVAVINFWATWCVPCVKEIPNLNQAYAKHQQDGLIIIGVNYQQNRERVLRFLKKAPISYPVALDEDGSFAKRFGVSALPVSIMINREGLIVHKLVGTLSQEVLERWIEEAPAQ